MVETGEVKKYMLRVLVWSGLCWRYLFALPRFEEKI
jgi:hypothetical protein